MTRVQRFKYEMFVRVSRYGAASPAVVPASSPAGARFARVTTALETIQEALKKHAVADAEARKVKAATRAAVCTQMKTLARAARRATRAAPATSPFRMPRRRSLQVEIATARTFLKEAEARQDQFARFGLPPTFVSDFRARVDRLQQAADARRGAQTARRQAQANLRTAFAQGMDAIRDLDAIMPIATEQDPVAFAGWRGARRIDGPRRSSSTRTKAAARA